MSNVSSIEPIHPYTPRGRAVLIATVNHKGRATTVVHVRGALPFTPDSRILDAALQAAGETRSSIFGHAIDRTLDVIAVSLWTD